MNKINFKFQIQIIFLLISFVLLCFIAQARTTSIKIKTFKIATYNVENLFDLNYNKNEYKAYHPNTNYGWNKNMLDIKIANIAKVIKDLNADVIALQEIESKKALGFLNKKLKDLNINYSYIEIADSKPTSVKCAVLSKFPIIRKKEIPVNNKLTRNILKITLNIHENHLILFINHWKSKKGPETLRIACARALKKEINKLKNKTDFILLGDFNSNYNEYKTFQNSKKLNDTHGITGINHILKTCKNSKMVNEKTLIKHPQSKYLYNLWLEINKSKRWSCFFRNKNTLDNIILAKGLYDNKGISYVDNSFNKFMPDYLFRDKEKNANHIYRWQRARKGRGRHLGKGYSDHIPIFAYFSSNCHKADLVFGSWFALQQNIQEPYNIATLEHGN